MNRELENLFAEYVKASIDKNPIKRDRLGKVILERSDLEMSNREALKKSSEERAARIGKIHRICDFCLRKPGDIPNYKLRLKCGEEINVYRITDPNVLARYVGYGKYLNRQGYNVFMRGQSGLFGGAMVPSLFRTISMPDRVNNPDKLVEGLKRIMNQISNHSKSMNDYAGIVMEPLLQHYGIKTTMIDLVDNMWIALWFGLNRVECEIVSSTAIAKSPKSCKKFIQECEECDKKTEFDCTTCSYKDKCVKTNSTEYVYYMPRETAEWKDIGIERQYAYIFLIATDAIEETQAYGRNKSNTKYAGIYEGDDTIAVDLRKALQSRFLRPHAQHGIMLKKKGKKDNQFCSLDYSDLIVGIAEIPVELGQKWIGSSSLLNVSTLFPSPVYDSGYGDILKAIMECSLEQDVRDYGSIQIING